MYVFEFLQCVAASSDARFQRQFRFWSGCDRRQSEFLDGRVGWKHEFLLLENG